ncbi:hypothetical protein FEE96_08835 [Parasedimentitalea maritima]|uniref:Mitochondrial inner membrane protein n=1 Tax=Parasedimentitalea maritima TaxID=2578117 RepID=A0ABY2UVS2_9RHOB|nr:hypothetical protein FEE96_08835 [Zongyanglinia marina]
MRIGWEAGVADKNNSDLVSETSPNDDLNKADMPEAQVEVLDDSVGAKPALIVEDESEVESTQVDEDPVAADSIPAEPAISVERVVEKRGGFGMAILGGAIAAGLGFVAAQTQFLNPILPESLKSVSAKEFRLLIGDQAEINEALAALQVQVESSKTPDLSGVTTQIAEISVQIAPLEASWSSAKAQLEALSDDVTTLTKRLSDLEKRPISEGASPAAVAAYEAELSKLQESLIAQRQDVERMVAEAQALDAASAEAARIASAQTMVARLRSNLDSGTAYGSILTELESVGVTVPEALLVSADQGVATLTNLTSDFVPAAREALSVAREDSSGSGGLLAYAQRHLGARSVQPRDGDDPDAILSRAEAAISTGDLDRALAEIQTLPESARSVMLDWETDAKTRQDAVAAVDALAHSLNAN